MSLPFSFFTVALEPDESVVEFGSADPFVVLVCELYGYLSVAPEIEWRFRNQPLTNDATYNISEQEGNHTIEFGGVLTPSRRSYLNVSTTDSDSITGDYLCLAGVFGVKTVTLVATSVAITTDTETGMC